MKKIKIIHVVHDFLFGGIEAFLFYLIQIQKNNSQIEVSILCCQEESKVANRRIIETGLNIYYVRIMPFERSIVKYKRILQIVNKYDIIHLHSYKPILAEILLKSNSKILYTNHSAGIEGRPVSLSYRAKNKLLVFFLNRINGITNNSIFTKNFWEERGMKNENNWVVYNGVLFENKIDSKRPFNEFPDLSQKYIIGTTSRFIAWKRIDYLIDAFSKFQINKDDVRLLLVGDGDTRDHLVKKVKDLDLEHKVVFTGFKNNVIDYQSIMDVCVFASHGEPFGLVAVECLHLGKPVIVFKDGGGITEIIEGVELENVVSSIDDLSSHLQNQYKFHKSNRIDLKKTARIAFAEEFNVKIIENKFFNIYKQL